MKSVESVKEKIHRKGKKIEDLDDISGTRILTENKLDQMDTVEKFKKLYGDKIKPGSEDDYYSHPKNTGYKAYHATVIENGQPHEVQIRTKNFNKWAELYHPIYKSEPWTGTANNSKVIKYFNDVSRVIDDIDSGKHAQLPIAPFELDLLGLVF
jgi:(p)ppGpp synthase/HD superfamily hydrolase